MKKKISINIANIDYFAKENKFEEFDEKINGLKIKIYDLMADFKFLLNLNENIEKNKYAAVLAFNAYWDLTEKMVHELNKFVVDENIAQKHPWLNGWIKFFVQKRNFFPINYNELVDLSPYGKLKIGHRVLEKKSAKIRAGNSAFYPYAVHLVKRISELNFKQRQKNNPEFAQSIALMTKLQLDRCLTIWSSDLQVEYKEKALFNKIYTTEYNDIRALTELPFFPDKESAKQWAKICKELFKKTFPKCEDIKSLAAAIGDGEVRYESQIRARIVERIGRAVISLARY
jgi:hypothetical protein